MQTFPSCAWLVCLLSLAACAGGSEGNTYTEPLGGASAEDASAAGDGQGLAGSGGDVGAAGTLAAADGGGVSQAGSGGDDTHAVDGGERADGGVLECEPSTITGDQVVFIGDSFIAAPTSAIAPNLGMLFMQDGSSAYSATPRYHQLVGTTMAQISAQYDTARSQNPDIKAVIMDGGGNDVLVTDRSCLTEAPPANAHCADTVAGALEVAEALFSKMESDGVEHVVYFFYPHEPTSGIFQGTAPTINESLDYAEPRAREVCEAHDICTFVSLREATGDAIGSGYTERGYINANDVHPSTLGSEFFAGAIWQAMKARCVLNP